MKTKLGYLNFILTVCAIALTIIVLQNANIITKAQAAPTLNSLPLNEKGELPVRVMNSEMEVKMAAQTLDVNIDEVGGYSTYGTVPVKIKN